ncbi:hypothetical protein DACRYDRAFT_81109 [Dacryopinax primogenitus]|uniref:Bax inhibitor family protein n=1 Tax=Dacryopinax primogenitus (strain DJM 731) TaxID=1858805 RepID=M5FWY8_DACPD|nr:uncharacterized protein DACRYDRAFT_81109 [Dacryopinax primogenitus]EJU00195.1 hypothetical protein DACRYDRAFT_81109 [Dacryopinax primogenitus]
MTSLFRTPLVATLRVASHSRPLLTPQFRTFLSSSRPLLRPTVKASKPLIASLTARRFASNYGSSTVTPLQPISWTRIGSTVLLVAGGIIATNFLLNRHTRGAYSEAERSFLNHTFWYVGGGLTLTAGLARYLHSTGFSLRLMAANPWLVLGLGLVGSIGTMMGTLWTSPDNTLLKHTFFTAFQACQAATLSPIFFLFPPAIIARAALYTVGMVAALAYIGGTAKNDQYLYMGGPLLAGLVIVALSSLAPMVLPATAMRTLALTEAVSLYGGLAVFGGFVLFDTQKILAHARLAEAGRIKRDPIAESISLELDFINIFIRMLQILGMQQRKK